MENDTTVCACLSCFWIGIGAELCAEACPDCDGRVADKGSPEFEARMQQRFAEFTRLGNELRALEPKPARLIREGKPL